MEGNEDEGAKHESGIDEKENLQLSNSTAQPDSHGQSNVIREYLQWHRHYRKLIKTRLF